MVSILGGYGVGGSAILPELYSIFTLEPLQNLFLGVYNLVKFFMIQYMSSSELSIKENGPRTKPRLFNYIRT